VILEYWGLPGHLEHRDRKECKGSRDLVVIRVKMVQMETLEQLEIPAALAPQVAQDQLDRQGSLVIVDHSDQLVSLVQVEHQEIKELQVPQDLPALPESKDQLVESGLLDSLEHQDPVA